jgi:hypothetical protein
MTNDPDLCPICNNNLALEKLSINDLWALRERIFAIMPDNEDVIIIDALLETVELYIDGRFERGCE